MSDITLVYFTPNLLHEFFAKSIRDHLIESSKGKPIISVSQKPIDFGYNICVDLKPCHRSEYEQLLIGVKAAKTKYIACCEDDTLYVPEHFEYEPPDNKFGYNLNHWHLRSDIYFYRGHKIQSMCIAPTELMTKVLEKRLEEYTVDAVEGRRMAGIKDVVFNTKIPPITFRHKYSQSGIPRIPERYKKALELPYWGKAPDLWNKFYG